MTIEALWTRLEAVAKRHGKTLRLRPGVSEAAIAAAEATMKLAVPADFRASLALHDGQDDSEYHGCFPWMPGCCPLRSLTEIVAQWQAEVPLATPDDEETGEDPPDPRLRRGLSPRRIPIAGNRWWDAGNSYIDLAPGPEGTEGQLVSFSSECDLEVLGTSFGDALEAYVGALEARTWLYDPHANDTCPSVEQPGTNSVYAFARWRAS
jgi:cell wall assembly regulator SMI1